MDYFTPTYSRGKGKIAQLLFLTLAVITVLAVAGGVFLFLTKTVNSDVETLQDINQSFAASYDYKNITQEQDTETGRVSTTISGDLNLTKVSLNERVDALTNAISKVNKSETVNLDLTIKKDDNTVHLKYFAETYTDYSEGKLDPILRLINEALDNTSIPSYSITIRPTNSGQTVTVKASAVNRDSLSENDYRRNLNDTINSVWSKLSFEYGDVFDITYSNLKQGEANIVPVTLNVVIDSQVTYEKATTLPDSLYKKINGFSTGKYKSLYPALTQVTEVIYTSYPVVHSDRLLIVSPIEDQSVLATVASQMTGSADPEKLFVPTDFDVIFRTTPDGVNTYSIWNYYN